MTITRNAFSDSFDDGPDDGLDDDLEASADGPYRGQTHGRPDGPWGDHRGDPFGDYPLGAVGEGDWDDWDDWDAWDEGDPPGADRDRPGARRAPAHDPLRPTGALAAPMPGPIDTDADVLEQMLTLVGVERDGPRALWMILLDPSNRPLPIVVPITDLPTMVDRAMVVNLAHIVRTILATHAPGGSVAFALVRRAGGDRGTFEAGWSDALHEGLALVGVRVRAVVAIGRDRARVLPGRPA